MNAEEKFPRLMDHLNAIGIFKDSRFVDQAAELRELLAFWDAQQWQDISTAPRDGSTVELWTAKGETDCFWSKRPEGFLEIGGDGKTIISVYHWRKSFPKGPQ